MDKLSIERVKFYAGAEPPFGYTGSEINLMARELLALREAGKEPVGYTSRENIHNVTGRNLEMFSKDPAVYRDPIPLYASPNLLWFGVDLAEPQLPAVPECPESLPCPVLLEPGFRFGKGVPTSSMLGALQRRAEREAELDAMSPEAKAEYDASIEKLKSVLMPDVAEQRLASAVELLKKSAPHMLADESLKDPDGALCGKFPAMPEGWVMVPIEATSEMLNAAWISHGIHHPSAWRTMIAAAPKSEVSGE